MKFLALLLLAQATLLADPLVDGRFAWSMSEPLIDVGSGARDDDPCVSIKDPTVVFHQGQWHIIATLRKKSGKVMMQQLSFSDWAQANAAPRATVVLHDAYHCAPQVFWFTPHQRWYLVYQAGKLLPGRGGMVPCFSTTTNIADAKSWSKPQPLITRVLVEQRWIDFWVICDAEKAHLFYTSNDGHLWRRETKKSDFPLGWSEQKLALKADLFEASHTYKIKGQQLYLTLVEAQGQGRRYFKAYTASQLDGQWLPLADSLATPFAARENITPANGWADSISHGELLRSGIDETLEIDPMNLRFLFQGVSAADYRQKYGSIPWRLGLLEAKP